MEWPGDRYTWDLYEDPDLNFALENDRLDPDLYFVDGMYEGHTVQVHNLPPGFYFLRVMVWDEVGCTNNLILYTIEVLEVPEFQLYGDEACFGDPTYLQVVFTGTGPWEITYTDGLTEHSVNFNGNVDEWFEIPVYPVDYDTYDQYQQYIKEYWISWIKDTGRDAEGYFNEDDAQKARVVIYPLPRSSEIYRKEEWWEKAKAKAEAKAKEEKL